MPPGGASSKPKRSSTDQQAVKKTSSTQKEKDSKLAGASRWLKGSPTNNTSSGGRSPKGSDQEPAEGSPQEASQQPQTAGQRETSKSSTLSPSGSQGKGTAKGILTVSNTLEDFFASGLLQVDAHVPLVVSSSEPLSSVLEQLHAQRLVSCIVSLTSGQQENFDLLDFGQHLLEVVLGAPHGKAPAPCEDWEVTKKKLRKFGAEPVRKALKSGRSTGRNASTSNIELKRFPSDEGLAKLLPLFKTQRSVPVLRAGELCRMVTPGDMLELCMCVSEDAKSLLEHTRLAEIIAKCPGMLSKLEVLEDQPLAEAMHLMREANAHVVPILAGPCVPDSAGPSLSVGRRDSNESNSVEIGETGNLVGQFDIASLRALFLKTPAAEGDSDSAEGGQWWWEDGNITTNIFSGTCMDFLALAPSSVVDDHAPYAAVLSSEPLARAVSRAVATSFQSVVVYQVDSGSARPSAPSSRAKPLEGLACTLGLATALLEAEVFESLTFDASKQRRQKDLLLRRPTLTAADVQVVLGANSPDEFGDQRKTKVHFNSVIELDALAVPTCPDHGMHFMRFSKDEDPKNVMDFHALKDWVTDAKALNCASQCLACRRNFGRICQRAPVAGSGGGTGAEHRERDREERGGADASGGDGGIRKAGSGGFLGAVESLGEMLSDKANFIKGAPPKANGSSPRIRSALKAGTPGAGASAAGNKSPKDAGSPRKMPAEKRSSASSSGKKSSGDKLGSGGSGNGNWPSLETAGSRVSLFGVCCVAPCPCAGSKDQISAAAGARGREYRRVSDTPASTAEPADASHGGTGGGAGAGTGGDGGGRSSRGSGSSRAK